MPVEVTTHLLADNAYPSPEVTAEQGTVAEHPPYQIVNLIVGDLHARLFVSEASGDASILAAAMIRAGEAIYSNLRIKA